MATTQTWQQNRELIRRLQYCRHLPTLPAVALRLIDLADDASASLEQFAELIALDPALTGKLLRVANSSFYGHLKTVSSLTQGVGLLGLNATITLALSFSLRCRFPQPDGPGIDTAAYWRGALITALACHTIATELHEAQPEDFLLAGLLQDIGVLAMDAMLGAEYAQIHARSTDHADLLQQELAHFGFNHAHAGAHMLKSWKLPDRIADSVWLSHESIMLSHETGGTLGALPCCVAAAAWIAQAWHHEERNVAEALAEVCAPVQALLNIGLDRYETIISTMTRKMPEMEALFDTHLVDARVLAAVEDSARELLVIRGLRPTHAPASAGLHIQALEQRVATLEQQTQRDGLTGLYNRTHLQQILEREFALTSPQRPLSLAFLDLDQFKSINDTYGHSTGDQVLAAVARRLLGEARQSDVVARYGGEEFVVLLPRTTIGQAEAVLQRMLAAVRDTPVCTRDGASITVAFSGGLVAHTQESGQFRTPAAMLEAADSALYDAKEAGRGQIAAYLDEDYWRSGRDSNPRPPA